MQLPSEAKIKASWKYHDPPLVSVTIIAYNHEKYIAQAIDGALIQKTDFPFEIIIHDDASTDNTQAIIKEYAEKYPTLIRPILQTENHWLGKGINATTTIVWPSAKGKYIAWCEGDDYWTDPLKLQKQVDFMEKDNLVLSFHHGFWIDDNFQMLELQNPLPEVIWDFKQLLNRWPLTASIMFRASILLQYEYETLMNYTLSGDQMLMLLVAAQGKCGILEDFMCHHIVHVCGITHLTNKREWILNRLKSLEMINCLTNSKYFNAIQVTRKKLLYHFAENHSKDLKEKLIYTFKAFSYSIRYFENYESFRYDLFCVKCIFIRP